jgi:hypothetical protein
MPRIDLSHGLLEMLARDACSECLLGLLARNACSECSLGMLARVACSECLLGLLARVAVVDLPRPGDSSPKTGLTPLIL